MSTSFRRAALLAAAVLTSVALTPVASYAESWSAADPSADMVQVDDAGTATPAPGESDSDITGTSAKLGYHWLRVRTTFADLSVSDSDSVNPQWRVATPDGHKYVVNAFVSSVEPAGEWQIGHEAGNGVRCPRMTHSVNFTAHTMTAWIPAKCLGNPRYVKVGATGTTLHFEQDGTLSGNYQDDALQAGAVAAHAVLGPRVHRWS
jgi:hypothetical protein